MLRVVQAAAWDWEPPHMSGYPHLPPPCHHNTRPLMRTVNPSTPTTNTRRGTPTRRCCAHPPPPASAAWRAAAPPPLLCPMARPPSQPPSRRSFERRCCLARSPMWHSSRRCVGGCGQPNCTSSVAAFNAWFVRSRESHVCGPPVSSAQCFAPQWPPLRFHRFRRRPTRRGAISPLSDRKELAPVPWRSSRLLCCVFPTFASLSPLEADVLCVARVLRVLRVLRVVPPRCLWRRDANLCALCRNFPQRPKVKRLNKDARRPQKAPQRVRRSPQGAMVVRQVSRSVLWCHCRFRVMPVWFCCSSGIRPGVCCAFCACCALHLSRFWPSFGEQEPVLRVLQTPVRVKEEPPDSAERHAEPEGAPDTETAAEGKMTDGVITEI